MTVASPFDIYRAIAEKSRSNPRGYGFPKSSVQACRLLRTAVVQIANQSHNTCNNFQITPVATHTVFHSTRLGIPIVTDAESYSA